MCECDLMHLFDIPELKFDQQLKDTYRRGKNRWIDFMLGMHKVKSCVKRRVALENNDGIVSDHRGLYIDLDPATLFGGTTDDPVAASSHGFTSKNEKKTEAYLNQLDKYFVDHKICARIDRLINDASKLTRVQLK
jgi:hypothetical protein